MDRQIIYPGQIPLETDLLNTNRNTMVALGKLAGAIFGTGTPIVNGLTVAPSTPASLSVSVAAGEIYSLENVDNTAYSSLAADTTDTTVKQGIALASSSLACAAPTTAGFSINYLIEATFAEVDGGATVLPYYNASNPTQAYSGPNNAGTSQATTRSGQVQLQAKPGVAATTGSQVTPTVDAGYVALAVVTVANGQTTIVAGDITAVTTSVLPSSLLQAIQNQSPGRLLNIQAISSSATYTRTAGASKGRIRMWGGGGGGSGGSDSSLGGGGGGAGYVEAWIDLPETASATVGAGGTAGAIGAVGGSGGTSTFLTLSAIGGGGSALASPPGIGGTASGGYLNVSGTAGRGPFSNTAGAGQGGASFGSSGGNPHFTAGDGGISPGGGAGGGSAAGTSGTTSAGGAGGAGLIIVEEYA